jgi:hypothetical protein
MMFFREQAKQSSNPRSALDARTALCFHIEAHWPGASESATFRRIAALDLRAGANIVTYGRHSKHSCLPVQATFQSRG